MIAPFGDRVPRIDASAFVAASAIVIGDVEIAADASLWFHAVVRGDVERVRIGARTNVQDNATVHVTRDRFATVIGSEVTVGHGAIVHGATVGDRCLVGMGAILLDGVVIEHECLIGAGALVPPGMHVPARSLVLGSPARRVRDLNADELAYLSRSAAGYVAHAAAYRAQGLA